MAIRMIAMDLDGTLLRDDKTLSAENIAAVKRAVDAGVVVVIASARPPRAVKAIYEALGLDTIQINYNGAAHYDQVRGRFVKHLPLEAGFVREMVNAARDLDEQVYMSLEVMDKWYTDGVDDSLLTETSKHFKPDLLGELDELFEEPVTKLMLLAPKERLAKVHAMVLERFGERIAIHMSDEHLIQIVDPSVDKEHSVRELAGYYGIDRVEVMAIGDAQNDAGMIAWAGLGVAVGNAWDEAKVAADEVVGSNEENGVAEAIERFVLGA
ncbi:Cof-type HAD-IIB family hydrolase [Poriferisphaera sp. WC338]|uniref:Cof-type HAD-IIB family hydrolase n=1 Tax=Poriferisphaera sp. WC338 TaxID=3425129 RepID=UPI003D8198FF